MSAASMCMTVARAAGTPQRPTAATTSRQAVRCQACASFSQVQAPSLASTSSSFSVGSQQALEGPSCPWPRLSSAAPAANAQAASSKPACGIWAWLMGEQENEAEALGSLPPEVERLMRFTDAPEASAEQPQGWLSMWRYQGFK